MKNNYAILRTKKLSDNTRITKSADHNLRTGFISKNVNTENTSKNIVLENAFGAVNGKDFTEKLEEYYKSKNVEKRKNNVLLMEFVLTASPEFFRNLSEEEKNKWLKKQKEFMQNEFGEAVKFAVAHLDEHTPHIHCFVSTEHTTTKKYKNRYGECEKTSTTLNAKRFDRDFLIDLQTRFAKFNEKFGLVRGAFHSKAKNKSLKSFYRAIEKAADDKSLYKKIVGKINDVKVPVSARLSNEAIAREVIEAIKPEIMQIASVSSQLKKYMQFNFADLQNKLKHTNDELKKDREKLEKEKADLLKQKQELEETKKAFDLNHMKRIELERLLTQKEKEIADLKTKIKPVEEEKQQAQVQANNSKFKFR